MNIPVEAAIESFLWGKQLPVAGFNATTLAAEIAAHLRAHGWCLVNVNATMDEQMAQIDDARSGQ